MLDRITGVEIKGGSGADIISKGWRDNGWDVPTLQEKFNPDRIETVMYVSYKGQKEYVATDIVDKLSIKQNIVDKIPTNVEIVDKYKINDDFIDKIVDIVVYLKNNPHSSTETLSTIVNKSVSRTKNFLQAMVELDCIIAEGANKNRTYSLKQ